MKATAGVYTMDDLELIEDSTSHPVFVCVDVAKIPVAYATGNYLHAQSIRERHLGMGSVLIALSAETVAKIRKGETMEILL